MSEHFQLIAKREDRVHHVHDRHDLRGHYDHRGRHDLYRGHDRRDHHGYRGRHDLHHGHDRRGLYHGRAHQRVRPL